MSRGRARGGLRAWGLEGLGQARKIQASTPAHRVFHLAIILLILCARTAAAHDRTTSYSTWDIRGRDAHVTVRLSALDVTRFPWASTAAADLDRLVGQYLSEHLQLSAGA